MSQNSKNQLQEYCQKRQLPLPVYDTKHTGPSHSPDFMSTVVFKLKRESDTYQRIKGEIKKKAIEAEKSAATIALMKLSDTKNKFTIKSDNQLTILWDMENVNAKEFFENNYIDGSGIKTIGFVTAHHPQSLIPYPFDKTVKINSYHRDSADMALVMYLSSSITNGRGGHYIIVTKDHFAASLNECVKNNDIFPLNKNIENKPNLFPYVTQARSIDHLIELLDEHCSHNKELK